jgi:hypothetical protein
MPKEELVLKRFRLFIADHTIPVTRRLAALETYFRLSVENRRRSPNRKAIAELEPIPDLLLQDSSYLDIARWHDDGGR